LLRQPLLLIANVFFLLMLGSRESLLVVSVLPPDVML